MTAHLNKVAEQLAARPKAQELLRTFVDHWGLDYYDPPEETVSLVRQIILLAVSASEDVQQLDEQRS
jgi:hypothetical protein